MRSPHVRNKTGKKPPARKSLKALMHHYNLGNQRHRAMADCIDIMIAHVQYVCASARPTARSLRKSAVHRTLHVLNPHHFAIGARVSHI